MLFPKTSLMKLIAAVLILAGCLSAQSLEMPRSQEMSEEENVPVLLKHLPAWESKRETARYFIDTDEFRQFLSARPISKQIEFLSRNRGRFCKISRRRITDC